MTSRKKENRREKSILGPTTWHSFVGPNQNTVENALGAALIPISVNMENCTYFPSLAAQLLECYGDARSPLGQWRLA